VDFLMLVLAHSCVLRVLQSQIIVQYYDDNPADVSAIVMAVTRRTLLSTPAPAPCDDVVSTPLPSQHKYTSIDFTTLMSTCPTFDSRLALGPHETCLSDPHCRGRLAVEDGVEMDAVNTKAYCEVAEESETEQTGGIFCLWTSSRIGPC
jgi:hypothetical protein